MPDGTLWCNFFRLEASEYLLRFPGLADFLVSADARSISAVPVDGLDEGTLNHLFLNQVLPLAMSRQHKLVLHGSAAVIDNSAATFIGPSGRGKSTLVASFATAGFPFLTDDGLQLQLKGDSCLVCSGPASIRLWQDSSSVLMPPDSKIAPAISYSPKARLLAGETLMHCTESIPLRAFYILEKAAPGEAVSIAPCGGREALMSLVRNSFLLDVEEKDHLKQHFVTLSALARLNLVYTLRYPHDYAHLEAVRTAVCNHVKNST